MLLLLALIVFLGGFSGATSFVRPSREQFAIGKHDHSEHQGNANIVQECSGYPFPHVICVKRHGSVINGDFERNALKGSEDSYGSTTTPGDTSFDVVKQASFLLFDSKRSREVLGSSPSVDFMFPMPDLMHEGPVYIPDTNELYFSRVKPGFFPQLVVNLSVTPPSLSEKLADPPIYAGTGGKYHKGEIIYATVSGNPSIGGYSFHPGLYALNPRTGKSRTLLNNYYGYYFNSLDDMDIDHTGRIWFTNNNYGHSDRINTHPPQLHPSTFRFDPSTGETQLVEHSLNQPNGIALSPSGKTLYISDTGAATATSSPFIHDPQIHWNATNPRVIYAFDVDPTGAVLMNKRPIYQPIEYASDGIKVSGDGRYLIAATGGGVDVLDSAGGLVGRVQVNFTVANLAWTGGEEVWLVGRGGVARVRWGLKG